MGFIFFIWEPFTIYHIKTTIMLMLTNEEKLVTSNQDKVVLTNQRVFMRESQWGQSYAISIFLEDISSVETKYKSNIFFIVVAVISIVVGVVLGAKQRVGLIVGGIFLLLWWFSRKHIISISSDGGSTMNFLVEGMRDEKIEGFIQSVSEAKLKRVNELSSGIHV